MASTNWYKTFDREQLILRDVLAIDRTRLAYERTLLAYMRSGLYFVFAGLSILAFETLTEIHYLGWGLIPLGIGTVIVGVLRHIYRVRRLSVLDPARIRIVSEGADEEL
ncbi:MAG: DUF202 domain-containing protein [Bacteroidia bacterium]|jgi:putative membrane protein|nr:DUF202 domain-containing protein [Bacteroidia bacterium]